MASKVASLLLFHFILLVNIVTWNCVAGQDEAACSINMNGDLPEKNQPLMLKKRGSNYSLAIPKVKGKHQGFIELHKGEQLVLACPGKNNYLEKTSTSSATSSCSQGTELTIGDVAIKSVEAHCHFPATAQVFSTGNRCAKYGSSYEIGFQAEGWHRMIEVCFHLENSNTYYTKHVLIGAALSGAEYETDRPQFSEGDRHELYGFNPNNYYKKTSQKRLFETTFGKTKSAEYYNDERKFLSRGHLAPDGDFLFGSWQFATYFYINAAPQWLQINDQNWLKVEKSVRLLASTLKKDFVIFTGTYGILALENEHGKQIELYLDADAHKLPVPEYYWKVVYEPESKEGIAIVTSNNPYLKEKDIKHPCSDIDCRKHKWLYNPRNITEGYTICCNVDNFRDIGSLPSFKVEGILDGPLKVSSH